MTSYAIPVLLREARGSYMHPLREALSAAGLADLPRRGGLVLTRLRDGQPVPLGYESVAAELQARGYLEGSPSRLTERGERAAETVVSSVTATDEALCERIGAEAFAGLRAGLTELARMAESAGGGGDSPPA